MQTDYNRIREDNILAYGEDVEHLEIYGRLYSDRTHFVFELLQNAEDAGATRILFNLFNDRLEVLHDGRLFNEQDVIGLCKIGKGTKLEDLTQIGKHGIGFKSVNAYTATPEVHCGDENFRIENYVRPYAVPPKQIGNSWTTFFILPFNNKQISPSVACEEIDTRLRNLSARTLLFLRNIREIEYMLPNSVAGVYLREESTRGSAREVNLLGQNNDNNEEESWLIFERAVAVPGKSDSVRVEVSFCLEQKVISDNKIEQIIKVKDSPLVVYFPTEKETRFGFLIQGPYRTTPSRDNIPKDDEWNETLVSETAELIKDCLPKILDMGLLSVSFIEALPIRTEDFSEQSMFYPIVESVRNSLIEKELLPADDGSFVSASNAKLASADWLRQLLKQEQLRLLFHKDLKWVHGDITKGRRSELWRYLREDLKIEEVTPEAFVRKTDFTFFAAQSDQWLIEFYSQLPNQRTLWEKRTGNSWDPDGPLRKKPFIRLKNGSHICPFDDNNKPNAYLPARSLIDSQLPTVKAEVAGDGGSRQFLLSDLKIPEFDIVAEVVEHVLPKYTSQNPPNIKEHNTDIEKILEAYQTDSQDKRKRLKDALQKTPFIWSRSTVSDSEAYRRPEVLYSRDHSLELEIYFSGNSDVGFVSTIYQDSALDMFDILGVSSEIKVKRKVPKGSQTYINLDFDTLHRRGLGGFDPDISVDGLSHALLEPSVEKSRIIWNNVCVPNSACIRGKVLKSSRKDFSTEASVHKEIELASENFGSLLIDTAWMPTSNGEFRKPRDIKIDELPESFERNENLAHQLGMQLDVITRLAKEVGLSSEDIDMVCTHRDEFSQWKSEINSGKKRPTFPSRSTKNPERRKKRLIEQIADAPNKVYSKRGRSVRTSKGDIDPSTWLRNQYTNMDDEMICQICKYEMPFRKRDGNHYFEKKEILSRVYLQKEHEAQYLALCPLCAAKYEEFIITDDSVMTNLKEAIVRVENCEVPIVLGVEKTSIRFVETHYQDIKSIMEEMG